MEEFVFAPQRHIVYAALAVTVATSAFDQHPRPPPPRLLTTTTVVCPNEFQIEIPIASSRLPKRRARRSELRSTSRFVGATRVARHPRATRRNAHHLRATKDVSFAF